MNPNPFPVEGVEASLLLVVADVDRARAFYTEVLGARLFREYGGTTAVVEFQGTWILLVSGGGPTPGKPGVVFAPPSDPDRVSFQLTIRVPDCAGAYETLKARGAQHVYAGATHGKFVGKALENIGKSPIEEVVVTDTIPQSGDLGERVKVLSVAPLLGEAIKRIHEERSLSTLFV